MMKKLIVGNWKMNGSLNGARALIADVINAIDGEMLLLKNCEFAVCPPFVHIGAVRHAVHGFPHVLFGGQDCSRFDDGAFTGEVSAKMLKDSGCSYVVLGHSERRQHCGETSRHVAEKAAKALAADLKPIICVGETLEEREAGKAEEIVSSQLMASVPKLGQFDEFSIAYEPVWAIGTGKNASSSDIQKMHRLILAKLEDIAPEPEKIRILYGGSVKPDNAAAIFATPLVGGALIGGASLNAGQFLSIARAAQID